MYKDIARKFNLAFPSAKVTVHGPDYAMEYMHNDFNSCPIVSNFSIYCLNHIIKKKDLMADILLPIIFDKIDLEVCIGHTAYCLYYLYTKKGNVLLFID